MGKVKEQYMNMQDETRDPYYESEAAQASNFAEHEENERQSQGLTITTKKLQDLDKAGLTELAKAVVFDVQEGNTDAMDALIMFKKLETFAKEGIENVKGYAYGKTYATKGVPYLRFGTKVEAAELGTEYDYSNCNHPDLSDLEDEFKTAKENLDKLKKWLQTLPKPISMNDENTGEVVTVNPAIKKSTSGYKVTI